MIDRESLQSVSGLSGSGFLQVRVIFSARCYSVPLLLLSRAPALLCCSAEISSIALRLCIPNGHVKIESIEYIIAPRGDANASANRHDPLLVFVERTILGLDDGIIFLT